jgi:protease secretion system outer membrane protein
LPKVVAGSVTATNRLTNTYSGSISQNFDNFASNNNYVQLLQPLFDLSALAKYRQGMAQKKFGDAKFQADTYDLLIRTTQVYLEIMYIEDQITFIKSESAAFLEQMKLSEKSFKYGEASKLDYLEAKTAYEISTSQLLEAQLQLTDTKRRLGNLVGIDQSTKIAVRKLHKQFTFFNDLPMQFNELKELALENNYDLKAANYKVLVAREEISKNASNYLPQISAVANWNRQNSFSVSTVNVISSQTMGGIQATWPIFSGGETFGQTRQASALHEKSIEEYGGLRLNTLSDLQKFYDQVSFYQRKIKILQGSLVSAQETQKATNMGILAGIRTNYDALAATKAVFGVSKDLVQAKYAYILAYLKTKQLSGLIKVSDLEAISKSYFAE